jgi:hypothetical protein
MVAMLDTSHDPAGEPSRADGDALVFATLGTGLVLATAWTAFHFAPPPALPPASYDGTPMASLVDVTPLRRFHEVVLVGTAIVGAAGLLVPDFRRAVQSRAASCASAALALVLAAAIVAGAWLDPPPASDTYPILFGDRYGLLTGLSPIALWTAGLVSGCLALPLLRLGRIADHWTIWVAVLLYAGVLAWPGLHLPLDLGRISPGTLLAVEWHYDVFFGAKNDLVRGTEPAGFGYGAGVAVFTAVVEKALGPF